MNPILKFRLTRKHISNNIIFIVVDRGSYKRANPLKSNEESIQMQR
jgi:hypothetical protein